MFSRREFEKIKNNTEMLCVHSTLSKPVKCAANCPIGTFKARKRPSNEYRKAVREFTSLPNGMSEEEFDVHQTKVENARKKYVSHCSRPIH